MGYSVDEIAKILKANENNDGRKVEILLTDSRSLTDPEKTLFFSIKTRNNDGHKYMRELYDRGVRAFVAEYVPKDMEDVGDATIILVNNTVKSLQKLSKLHRKKFNIPIIGITGSKGKTTVKEWLYQLLSDDFNIVRSPRSYNSQIGVPLSVWEIDNATTLGIFEAGISMPHEMSALQQIIRPTIGIITNIGTEHSDGFGSIKEKCNEKIGLLSNCDCIIYNGDDKIIATAINESCLGAKEIAWSIYNSDSPLYISKIEKHKESTEIHYFYLRREGSVTIPFTDASDIQNAIHCLAVMLYFNRPEDVMKSRMASLTPVGTRMEVKEGVNNSLIVYDAYTSDLNSLNPALDFVSRRKTGRKPVTVIVSDVQHESLETSNLYKNVARLFALRGIRRVIGIGDEISKYSKYFSNDSRFFPSTSTFLAEMSPDDFDNELILIKGAARFHFERIADMLEARQHETVLEVNLDSLIHNYNRFRGMIRPTTGIVCMVKASGYGAGSYELAKSLQDQGAAYLAVAVVDEGVGLREAGITMPVMVMNPRGVNYQSLFSYHLEPEIYSFAVLKEIIREGEKYGISDHPAHIKLDTGMHRMGFTETDLPELISILKNQKVIRPQSLFSHLATADCLDLDDYTMGQFEQFERMCKKIESNFNHTIQRHILNTAGIVRFPEYQYDMVRLGIGLYGVSPLPETMLPDLKQVSSLRSVIISIREWHEGTTIGYGCKGVLKRRSRIATIPVGYADGIDRHLGNGAMRVWINGRRCPTIGNICMDACMIDVTDAYCQVGDHVEIFGDNVPVSELSDILETIPYEILTSVSTRVKRVYYRE